MGYAATLIGRFLGNYGHHRRALEWLKRAKDDFCIQFGPYRSRTQIALEDLVLILNDLGRFEESEVNFRQVLDSQLRCEGSNANDSSEMLTAMSKLSVPK